jgi:hypothetical protein
MSFNHGLSGWNPSGGSGGGLTYLAGSAFSTQASVSLDNCFSATYENYRIVATITAVSATGYGSLRLRVASTDASGANTYRQGGYVAVNGSSALETFTGTGWRVYHADNTSTTAAFVMDIKRPFTAATTMFEALVARHRASATSEGVIMYAGGHDTASSYDGFTLLPASGTFTGQVRVYGYQNS